MREKFLREDNKFINRHDNRYIELLGGSHLKYAFVTSHSHSIDVVLKWLEYAKLNRFHAFFVVSSCFSQSAGPLSTMSWEKKKKLARDLCSCLLKLRLSQVRILSLIFLQRLRFHVIYVSIWPNDKSRARSITTAINSLVRLQQSTNSILDMTDDSRSTLCTNPTIRFTNLIFRWIQVNDQ